MQIMVEKIKYLEKYYSGNSHYLSELSSNFNKKDFKRSKSPHGNRRPEVPVTFSFGSEKLQHGVNKFASKL